MGDVQAMAYVGQWVVGIFVALLILSPLGSLSEDSGNSGSSDNTTATEEAQAPAEATR